MTAVLRNTVPNEERALAAYVREVRDALPISLSQDDRIFSCMASVILGYQLGSSARHLAREIEEHG